MLVSSEASAWLTQYPLTHQSLIHRPLAVSLQAGFPETLNPQVVVGEGFKRNAGSGLSSRSLLSCCTEERMLKKLSEVKTELSRKWSIIKH